MFPICFKTLCVRDTLGTTVTIDTLKKKQKNEKKTQHFVQEIVWEKIENF